MRDFIKIFGIIVGATLLVAMTGSSKILIAYAVVVMIAVVAISFFGDGGGDGGLDGHNH